MKKIVLLAFALMIFSFSFSQRIAYAPNFGLTNEAGDTLYLDSILNDGQAVLLVFFGYDCVYCSLDVPDINDIYNDYGQNQDELFVWAIENNFYGDWQDIHQFENDYSTQYPIWNATNTDGSDSVSALYDVLFTPYYYVICPDGTYNDFDLDTVPYMINQCLGITGSDSEILSNNTKLIFQNNSLHIQSDRLDQYELKILSPIGQLLRKEIIRPENEIKLNLPEGLYLYSLSSGTERISGKIFIK